MNSSNKKVPKAFVSYSWDDDAHKEWVAKLAADLRSDGINVVLDQWGLVLGDELTEFMEKEIRENDYVLIVCTPNYRNKSDKRIGGVGYEGNIMTAEVLTKRNHRKFIPILARGQWKESAPSWLSGKFYVDLGTKEKMEANYSDLTATLHGTQSSPPVLTAKSHTKDQISVSPPASNELIKIIGVIVDEVSMPRSDGTHGSALYMIPFRLNRSPSRLWTTLFVEIWNSPPRWTTMHRPGIASVSDDKIILNGTTIEEVRKYHRDTLKLCVDVSNNTEIETLRKRREEEETRKQQIDDHRKNIEDGVRDLNFD